MGLDIAGLTLLILFFIRGYMKGLIVAAFSVLAILLGAVCALKLSEVFAAWLHREGIVTSGWGPLLSYLVLFTGVMLLVRLLGKAVESSLELVMLGFANKITGGLLYAGITAVIWSSLLWISSQMSLISPKTIAASYTYSFFAPIAPWVFAHVGAILPFAKDIFGDLQQFFDGINQTATEHVGTH
ncbi:MAG: CvpA family protein [Flavipsychrobacter sp.]|nr:CvpA family protein [Flavipsychrobacter sp.]